MWMIMRFGDKEIAIEGIDNRTRYQSGFGGVNMFASWTIAAEISDFEFETFLRAYPEPNKECLIRNLLWLYPYMKVSKS
jgi:hypothetical protein